MKRLLQLALAGLLVLPAAALAEADAENVLKVAYLVRFGLYVDWPTAVFAGPQAALVLCVAGDDPFGAQLDHAAAGQQVGARALQVRRIKAWTPDAGCHLVYLSGSEISWVTSQIDALRGQPVLTISDAARGAPVRGILHFVVRDDRVRFEIDDEAAARSGLQISSKLLGLALSVRARAR